MKRDVMTIDDVANYLRIGRRTVYRLVQSGALPGRKIASRWRFHVDDVEAWLRNQDATSDDPDTVEPGESQETEQET